MLFRSFTEITAAGVGNPAVLAGGISQALITTAAGLTVAIPSLVGFRYVRNKVDALVVQDRKSVVYGKSVDLGCRRIIKKTTPSLLSSSRSALQIWKQRGLHLQLDALESLGVSLEVLLQIAFKWRRRW